mmetsp:Transcript_28548/g.58439  ORF Transcript_28548/g.58439 Transcript_28548/m.58439 type:complete len:477 (-) Transcript_28548:294-1724(-)
MGQAVSLPFKLANTTLTFYRGFFHYLLGTGRHSPYLPPSDPSSTIPSYLRPHQHTPSTYTSTPIFHRHARMHLYTLASAFYLYHKPHYRKPSYRRDILDNFSNVAIPGTGIPLSYFVWNRFSALTLVCVGYPAISLAASVHKWMKGLLTFSGERHSISEEYKVRLLAPDDWFSYWRLNCRIAGLHAYLNMEEGSLAPPKGYEMENKWTFLEVGKERNVPISPYLTTPAIVVKHRNEEGGMGIHFYKNATEGGDWIIQERIENGEWVQNHLPEGAPLSTFRVITQSRGALDVKKTNESSEGCRVEDITALSCVFRAGRKGAETDHDSILFDVDPSTGKVLGGTTNAHWYRLGLSQILPGRCPWRSKDHAITHHPDGNIPVSGSVVPDIKGMLKLVEESHWKLCPDVPLVGWDVVLSKDENLPVCLLEVNLSCNFFRGSFDKEVYLGFLEDMVGVLQGLRLGKDGKVKGKVVKKEKEV